jgi:REP element-mobilizing transposase RayT
MKYNPDLHHRHSIRLRDYNYANAGAYFVTVCLNQRIPEWQRDADKIVDANFEFPILGVIKNGVMISNECGKIVQMVWNELPLHYENIQLDKFVVMPDHIHGIITIVNDTTNANRGLPEIVRALKTFSARKINGLRNTQGGKLWQRNYWEHVIRNEIEYAKIAEYIHDNPVLWGNKCLDGILPAIGM